MLSPSHCMNRAYTFGESRTHFSCAPPSQPNHLSHRNHLDHEFCYPLSGLEPCLYVVPFFRFSLCLCSPVCVSVCFFSAYSSLAAAKRMLKHQSLLQNGQPYHRRMSTIQVLRCVQKPPKRALMTSNRRCSNDLKSNWHAKSDHKH